MVDCNSWQSTNLAFFEFAVRRAHLQQIRCAPLHGQTADIRANTARRDTGVEKLFAAVHAPVRCGTLLMASAAKLIKQLLFCKFRFLVS